MSLPSRFHSLPSRFDSMNDDERERHAQLRAAICRKYSEQFWDEQNAGKCPNLALIINDAIGEAIEEHFKGITK